MMMMQEKGEACHDREASTAATSLLHDDWITSYKDESTTPSAHASAHNPWISPICRRSTTLSSGVHVEGKSTLLKFSVFFV